MADQNTNRSGQSLDTQSRQGDPDIPSPRGGQAAGAPDSSESAETSGSSGASRTDRDNQGDGSGLGNSQDRSGSGGLSATTTGDSNRMIDPSSESEESSTVRGDGNGVRGTEH